MAVRSNAKKGAGMMLSREAIEFLADIITGDSGKSPRRDDRGLIDFFRHFGERDLRGKGFSARPYVRKKLEKFNGTEKMKWIVAKAFNFFGEGDFNPEEEADTFNCFLAPAGYRLVIEEQHDPFRLTRDFMAGGPWPPAPDALHFVVQPTSPDTIAPQALAAIGHHAINEHITTANRCIDTGDFPGAITVCRTLIEDLLKLILREAAISFNENEGDIFKLYMSAREHLDLKPTGETIASPLNPILGSLPKLVAGFREFCDKTGNRHARRYEPEKRHARLAVNIAVTFCEFLVETHDYRRSQAASAADGDDRTASA